MLPGSFSNNFFSGASAPEKNIVITVKLYVLVGLFILLPGVAAFAATPTLTLGVPTVSGTTLTIPVNLINVTGRPINAIAAHLYYNNVSSPFGLKTSGANIVSAVIGSVAIKAGKQLTQSSAQSGDLYIVIYGFGNSPIGDGVIATIGFDIVGPATAGNESFKLYPTASDATGAPISVNYSSITLAPGANPLTVTVSPNGTVNSLPSGIACSNGLISSTNICNANFYANSVVALLPTAAVDYDLSAWAGSCTGSGPCAVTLSVNGSVTATFSLNNHVKITGIEYGSLTNAYKNALPNSTIMASDFHFVENLTLDRGLAVTLRGGYNWALNSQIGDTFMKGVLLVKTGSLVVDGLSVQ